LTSIEFGNKLITHHRVTMEETPSAAGLRVRIADIGVVIAARDAELSRDLAVHYQGFLDSSASAELSIDVETIPDLLVEPRRVELRGQPWLDVRAAGPSFRIRRVDFDGELDLASGTAALRCRPRTLSVDGFLRVCFSLAIIRKGGLMLHAASLVSRGRGHAFTGPSGAGKTTVCRLSGPRTVLTDETTIVRRNGRGFLVAGNPFPGELGRYGPNASFPLASINLLVKDSAVGVTPLEADEAIRALLANTLLHARDSEMSALALDAACAIAGEVAVRRLCFAQDPSFWEVVE
jgi:hypothetical protein